MSPTSLVLVLAGVAAMVAWISSLLSKDYSWVDRSWSVVPVAYVWVFAIDAHLHNARLDVMTALVSLWGARLTYNFARKGGYRGVEDYRWGVLRSRMSRARFQLFNFLFIVVYQNALLVLLCLPALNAYEDQRTRLNALDGLLCVTFLVCLVFETVADEQQWRFQSQKVDIVARGESPRVRFVQTGLFRYSRHPNYFFEILQWWIIFFFGAVARHSLVEWTVLGAVLLTVLFVGSTRFTEEISLSRYPEYALYQRRTSAIILWPAREVGPPVEAGAGVKCDTSST